MGAARTPQNGATLGGCESCSSRCSSLSPSLSRLLCSPRRRRRSQRTASRRTRGTDSSVNANGREQARPECTDACARAAPRHCRYPVGGMRRQSAAAEQSRGASGPLRVAAGLQEVGPRIHGAGAIAAFSARVVVGSDRNREQAHPYERDHDDHDVEEPISVHHTPASAPPRAHALSNAVRGRYAGKVPSVRGPRDNSVQVRVS
jgi:hypothetical protein